MSKIGEIDTMQMTIPHFKSEFSLRILGNDVLLAREMLLLDYDRSSDYI